MLHCSSRAANRAERLGPHTTEGLEGVTVSATNDDLQKARQLWMIAQEEYIADAERAIALALAAERDAALEPIRDMRRNFEAVIQTMDWSAKAPCAGVLDSVVQVINRALGESGA